MGQEPQNVGVGITKYDEMTIAILRDEQGTVVEYTLEVETARSGQYREVGEETSGNVGRDSEGVMIAEQSENEIAALEDEVIRLATENEYLRKRTSHLAEYVTSLNMEESRLKGGMENEKRVV